MKITPEIENDKNVWWMRIHKVEQSFWDKACELSFDTNHLLFTQQYTTMTHTNTKTYYDPTILHNTATMLGAF